jgi:hypothetical protein
MGVEVLGFEVMSDESDMSDLEAVEPRFEFHNHLDVVFEA